MEHHDNGPIKKWNVESIVEPVPDHGGQAVSSQLTCNVLTLDKIGSVEQHIGHDSKRM